MHLVPTGAGLVHQFNRIQITDPLVRSIWKRRLLKSIPGNGTSSAAKSIRRGLTHATSLMTKDNRILRRGPFKGKRIEMASTAGIEMFDDIAEDFMSNIFDLKAGQYLITDESSILDFVGVGDGRLRRSQEDSAGLRIGCL